MTNKISALSMRGRGHLDLLMSHGGIPQQLSKTSNNGINRLKPPLARMVQPDTDQPLHAETSGSQHLTPVSQEAFKTTQPDPTPEPKADESRLDHHSQAFQFVSKVFNQRYIKKLQRILKQIKSYNSVQQRLSALCTFVMQQPNNTFSRAFLETQFTERPLFKRMLTHHPTDFRHATSIDQVCPFEIAKNRERYTEMFSSRKFWHLLYKTVCQHLAVTPKQAISSKDPRPFQDELFKMVIQAKQPVTATGLIDKMIDAILKAWPMIHLELVPEIKEIVRQTLKNEGLNVEITKTQGNNGYILISSPRPGDPMKLALHPLEMGDETWHEKPVAGHPPARTLPPSWLASLEQASPLGGIHDRAEGSSPTHMASLIPTNRNEKRPTRTLTDDEQEVESAHRAKRQKARPSPLERAAENHKTADETGGMRPFSAHHLSEPWQEEWGIDWSPPPTDARPAQPTRWPGLDENAAWGGCTMPPPTLPTITLSTRIGTSASSAGWETSWMNPPAPIRDELGQYPATSASSAGRLPWSPHDHGPEWETSWMNPPAPIRNELGQYPATSAATAEAFRWPPHDHLSEWETCWMNPPAPIRNELGQYPATSAATAEAFRWPLEDSEMERGIISIQSLTLPPESLSTTITPPPHPLGEA